MVLLHSFLCILIFICGFFVSSSKNPVESVLFLILTFCNATAILFIFNAEFLGLTFIIIYVGAIAVLFLFVIMMLNIKNKEDNVRNIFENSYFIFFLGLYFLGFALFLFIKQIFFQTENVFLDKSSEIILLVDSLYNIEVMGQTLFNYFLVCFLIAGLILLIALIGSIVLTLRHNVVHETQVVHRQLSRTDGFLSFFK